MDRDNPNESDAKDEMEIATNWKRSFHQIYRQIKWLNAYGFFNKSASYKIVKKFMKEHFIAKDNVIDKCLI